MSTMITDSLQDLRLRREMCADAIAFVREQGSEPQANMLAVLDGYDAQLALLTGRTCLNGEARVDDGVRTVRDSLGRARQPFGQGGAHAATDKQVNFLRKLIATKDHGTVTIPAEVEGISKKACSALIDQLIDRPAKDGAPAIRLASDKQVAFVRSLMAERNWAGVVVGRDVDTETTDPATLTGPQASALIEILKSAPRKQVERAVKAELESGIYRTGEQIFKVYLNQAKTRMLAKLLVLPEGWTTMGQDERAEELTQPEWVYQGMADRFVEAGQRMSLDEAKAFGTIYGVCCNCGRTLTDEGSIEAGIGPICAQKDWS